MRIRQGGPSKGSVREFPSRTARIQVSEQTSWQVTQFAEDYIWAPLQVEVHDWVTAIARWIR